MSVYAKYNEDKRVEKLIITCVCGCPISLKPIFGLQHIEWKGICESCSRHKSIFQFNDEEINNG